MTEVDEIPIADIVVPEGRRGVRDLDGLIASIRELGLLNPITVLSSGRLVAGLHRLEACKRLGWATIPAIIRQLEGLLAELAELAEIDENLVRNELTELERAEQLKRRKDIYEALHPQTKHGAQGGGRDGKGTRTRTEGDTVSFSVDTADKAGVDRRTVQRGVQIATKLAHDVKEKVRGTAIEDNKTELLRLARMPVEEQRKAADKIASGEAGSVRAAKNQTVADRIRAEPLPTLSKAEYRVIVADPPWKYEKRSDDETHRAGLPYPDMTTEEICALPVASLAHNDCILWLWTTNAFMRDAYRCLDAWGFAEKTILTWAKSRMGTGDWLRGKTEHCILAVRGRPTVTLTNQTTLLSADAREHSRKPDEFYALVDALCPGSKIEMFAREPRAGWALWGAETNKFAGSAA